MHNNKYQRCKLKKHMEFDGSMLTTRKFVSIHFCILGRIARVFILQESANMRHI